MDIHSKRRMEVLSVLVVVHMNLLEEQESANAVITVIFSQEE